MTKKLLTGLFLALFCLPLAMQAQSIGFCGAEDHDLEGIGWQRLIANKEALANGLVFDRDETVYVPIKYHIFGTNAGAGYTSVSKVLDMHCRLNEEYLEHDIQFFIKGEFNYINSTNANDDPGANGGILSFHKQSAGGGAVNIFIAKNASTDNGLDGTTLGYYSPSQDWIVLKKDQITYASATLPHEMGHFFSLKHTFYGWDCTTYDDEVSAGNCAPVNGPCDTNDGIVPVELQDGSNCETAADLLCDTPPDYNLGFGNGGSCVYNGNACDPSGAQIEPMENNWMGYFEGCDYVFTPMQVEVIHADYNSSSRNYLRSTPVPTTQMVTETSTLEIPANGGVTANYNYVELNWSHAMGASKYIVEVDQLPTFSAAPKRWVVGVSEWGVFDLNANTTYYWRVRPYNVYSTCADWSETSSFTTGTTTTDVANVEELEDWTVFPNPVAQGQALTMNVEAGTPFDATVKVRNLAGQLVANVAQDFAAGRNQVEISTANLAAGLYFVSIQTAAGVTTKRVVISQ